MSTLLSKLKTAGQAVAGWVAVIRAVGSYQGFKYILVTAYRQTRGWWFRNSSQEWEEVSDEDAAQFKFAAPTRI